MSDQTIPEMTSEHASIMREASPLFARYAELGGRAVELQRRIFHALLLEQFPALEVQEMPRVTTVSAKDDLKSLHDVAGALRQNNITVTKAVYDPVRGEFLLFTDPTPDA